MEETPIDLRDFNSPRHRPPPPYLQTSDFGQAQGEATIAEAHKSFERITDEIRDERARLKAMNVNRQEQGREAQGHPDEARVGGESHRGARGTTAL